MAINKISSFSNVKPMLRRATMVGVLGLASIAGNIQAKPTAPQLDRDSYISQYIEQQQLRMAEKQKEQKKRNLVTLLGAAFAFFGGFLTYALVYAQATTPPYSDEVDDKKK